MKELNELNELLKYIDYYSYSFDEEETVIDSEENCEYARQCYNEALGIVYGKKRFNAYKRKSHDQKADDDFLKWTDTTKWVLDIAIDCVRTMSEQDREYIVKHLDAGSYHMGYALWIRNRYIHKAKKHFKGIADNVSSDVMETIFSILHPLYDYRKCRHVAYFSDYEYQELYEKYGESDSEVFEDVNNRLLEARSGMTVKKLWHN